MDRYSIRVKCLKKGSGRKVPVVASGSTESEAKQNAVEMVKGREPGFDSYSVVYSSKKN